MTVRLRIVPAVLACLFAAAPAFAQGGAKLAVGPDAGGYLCPDGRQLYVKSCYDASANANCGVVLMHVPPLNGFQRESTATRATLTSGVAACKVYPLEFRNDGTVALVLPKSAPPQQTAKAPAATPTPKTSPAATAAKRDDEITLIDGMAIGYEGVRSSLVPISPPGGAPPVHYVDEASRKSTGKKDIVTIWTLQVWPGGMPSYTNVSAVWTEWNVNCKDYSYELTVGLKLDRQANFLGALAIDSHGTSSKDPTKETPHSIACKTTPPSKRPRFASAKAAIADALAGAVPQTAAKPATPAAKAVVVAQPAKAPIRLPETETEKKIFELIKTDQVQAAVSVILTAPDGKLVPIPELTDAQGMTALHWAAANRNAAATRWLLDKKSGVNLADEKGRTPLKIALDNKETRVMTLLLDAGANPGFALPGHDEELKGFKKTSELVDFMIKAAAPKELPKPAKAPIRLPKTETEKKFFQAIRENRMQGAINVTIDAPDGKSIPIAKLTDEQGMTALHWAAANRSAGLARWLVDQGSDVDLADNKGRTPLRIALDNKDRNVMEVLLNIGGADARYALPGHDDELMGFKKTSDRVDFMIKTAGAAKN